MNSVGWVEGILLLWDARKIKVIDNWCFSLAVVIKDLD